MTASSRIAVVFGVGADRGLGAALCQRASRAGYHVVACGRTEQRIALVSQSIRDAGGTATAVGVDVTSEEQVVAVFREIDKLEGQLGFVGYNAGNAFSSPTLETAAAYFQEAWQVCCLGGFLVGREAGRRLADVGTGSILFTGATASLKARPPFLAFASAKSGLRAVAACLARDLGPRGVHVGHVIIDGGIAGEKLLGARPDLQDRMGQHGMLDPDAIAASYWQIHLQHPSAWSFEIDLRPYRETF